MWPQMEKTLKSSINGLLPGLVALSCLSAGWLLGYGLAPLTNASKTWRTTSISSGKSLTNGLVYRQDWAKSSDERTTTSRDFDK